MSRKTLRSTILAGTLSFATAGMAAAQDITEILSPLGTGTGSTFDGAYGLCVTPGGVLYAPGFSNNVFALHPDGTIQLVANSSGDGAGNHIDEPTGICADGNGNIYIACWASNNAFKITPNGAVSAILGSLTTGQAALLHPYGVACASDGSVYVTDSGHDQVLRTGTGSLVTTIIGPGGDGLGNALGAPYGVCVDANDNVYVSGFNSSNVFKIAPGGTITQILDSSGSGSDAFAQGSSLAVDSRGNVYAAGFNSDNVFKVAPDGTISVVLDSAIAGLPGSVNGPWTVVVGPLDTVMVACWDSSTVFTISATGDVERVMGPEGDGRGNPLTRAGGLAFGSAGERYVSGWFSDNVFEIVDVGTPYCSGDTTNACPCANAGQAGAGCANSSGNGGRLAALGTSSIQDSSFTLVASGLVPGQAGLFFQGDNELNGGAGVPFGDGLRCAAGNIARLELVSADDAGAAQSGVDIAQRGGVVSGQTKLYQLWYRDPTGSPCSGAFNTTNGLRVSWRP